MSLEYNLDTRYKNYLNMNSKRVFRFKNLGIIYRHIHLFQKKLSCLAQIGGLHMSGQLTFCNVPILIEEHEKSSTDN